MYVIAFLILTVLTDLDKNIPLFFFNHTSVIEMIFRDDNYGYIEMTIMILCKFQLCSRSTSKCPALFSNT